MHMMLNMAHDSDLIIVHGEKILLHIIVMNHSPVKGINRYQFTP